MSGNRPSLTVYAAEKLLVPFLLVVCLSFTETAWSQNYQNNINAASGWLASTSNPRVTLADGALVDGANSTRIMPYFSNLGVMGFTKNSTYYPNVKNWMEWYWNRVSWPDKWGIYGSINNFDVSSTGAETPVPDPDAQGNHNPDSTDSYAGTFLSLAYAYYNTGDSAARSYITSIQPPNSNRLDYVGEVVVHTKQSNGNNLTWARPDYNIEYLMDNCEAYRGLRDLASLYTAYGLSTQASFYTTHADQMLNGIQTALWNSANNDYYWYTTDSGSSGTVNWNVWYPDAVSQIFPIAFGVIQPTDQRAINIWNTFQSHWKNQWTSLSTGDQYPWIIVGYVAALMGDTTDANTFINNLQTTFVNNNFVGDANHFWSTNEAGYFIRLNAQMLGSGGSGPVTHVTISTPTDGATVTAPVAVQASATSTNGVSGWHIYDENSNIVFSAGAVSSINASLNFGIGTHRLLVRAWDNISGFGDQTINITVTSGPPPPAVPLSNHVYVVVLENHSYSSVIGSSSMPFLNNNANAYSLATNYYADTHPSIGNYFEMTTGQIITNNDSYTTTVTADNIVRHLAAAGKTWKEYSESIPSVGYTGGDSTSGGGPYTEHHNPLSYLSDVRGSSQANNLVPFTQLQMDINAGTLPNFGFIVPNNNDNAHDGTLNAADTWLQNNIFSKLLNSAPFQAGGDGLLFVVFDESDSADTVNGGGHVAAVLIGPKVKNGFQSTTLYKHESLLRTVNESLGLANFGDAVNAPDMAEFFK